MIVILADYVETVELLRYPMKLVPLATLVHMDVKAFPSRPSVPLLITNSILWIMSSHEARTDSNLAFQYCFLAVRVCFYLSQIVAAHSSILLLMAMDYLIRKFLFSRSRWHSQIAFSTLLMFFLVTQVRICEDESRILNDLHRIS
ncbi:conserved hypothetical protein [Trichinella spiralis]|uniref:hypothetical protein n=1 Tax=Trichinella spiralis TaxID=6334 RepID=UPI0001EFDA8F|nr:conserved hypothetical protein [Trichinella spiralis]